MEKINEKQTKNSRISNNRRINRKVNNSSGGSKSQKSSKATFINSKKNNTMVNNYNIGDIVWAKTGKYPIWPAIVFNDPESNIYFKNENNYSLLHIYYFNYANKRNWLRPNQIFEFNGKDNILREIPKLISYLSRRRYKQKWNKAVDEAECLTTVDRDDRLSAYFSNDILNYIAKKNKTQVYSSSDKLSTNDQQPAAIENQPSINDQQPAAIENQPSINDQQPAAIENQLSINDQQPAAIENQPSINDQQPAAIENQPSTSSAIKTNAEVYNGDFYQIVDYDTQFCNYKIEYTKEHPMILIPELCKLFYSNGWATGIGGGISIKLGNCIYISPSQEDKERIGPEDLFVQDIRGVDIKVPSPEKNLSKSECTPIFMCSYTMRDAGAVIHMNSLEVIKLCLLNSGKDIRIQDLQIVKGIYNEEKGKYYDINEEVIIPIIENSIYEKDLVSMFKTALKTYPMTSAVLIRNHGMYIWGKDWRSVKSQCECYDYAFKLMIFKKLNSL